MRRVIVFGALMVFSLSVYSQSQTGVKKSFFPMLKDGTAGAYVAFTLPKQNIGMALINPEGIDYKTDIYLGKRGATPADSAREKYLYFQTATDQLVTATGTFYATVTYLDKGQGALSLEYISEDKQGNRQPHSERVFLGDSGIWQQHSFSMPKATLDHSLEGETDFRLYCPGVYIHAVMLTRVPIINQNRATSSLFRQEGVAPPPGYEFGVFLAGVEAGGMWEKDNLLDDKARLYNAWGAPYIIDTVNIGMLQTASGAFDFSLYVNRVQKLAQRGLVWTPRFIIGDPQSLPLSITASLQKAVGTIRPKEGPMISIWDSRLPDVYMQVFDEFRRNINPQHLTRMVLSFAGDWGPLYLSSDSSNQMGWPDFWGGDPLAVNSFHDYLMRKYGNINTLRAIWREEVRSWNDVIPTISADFSPVRNLDAFTWYRDSLTALVREITATARRYFPHTNIVLEISDDFEFSATDPTALAGVADETKSSIVMITRDALPTASPVWLCFANACQRNNVKFGMRTIAQSGKKSMLPMLYSLSGEGGSIFYFSENFLAGEDAWTYYAENIGRLRMSSSSSRIALIFPRTSLTAESNLSFLRLTAELRTYFGFDVVDEENLDSITVADYPFIFVPWGNIWSEEALGAFERLARSGAALVVHAEEPWQTPRGNVEINERIFAVKLIKTTDGWRFSSRTGDTKPYENANPIARVERRIVPIGEPGDDVFLDGQWTQPENASAAKQFGFPFDAFRWMGERGSINLPMIAGKEYDLHLEGFIPQGKRVQIYVNREYLGGVAGNGHFSWTQPITGKLRSRNGDVNVLLRGQLWNMGEVLGATQTQRVSLALSKVSVAPHGENPDPSNVENISPQSPRFQRAALRGSWMRELGQGITLLAPSEYINEWVFREMLNTFVKDPTILDARYRFNFPPDGEKNGVYVKPLGRGSVYLNLNDEKTVVGGWDSSHLPRTIPPETIYYSN